MEFLESMSGVRVFGTAGQSIQLHFNVLFFLTLLFYRLWRRATLPVFQQVPFWERFRVNGGLHSEIIIALLFGFAMAHMPAHWTARFFLASLAGFAVVVGSHKTWERFRTRRQARAILQQYREAQGGAD